MSKAHDYCKQQVLSLDRARGLALLTAPRRHQDGLFALHAFNLELAKVAPLVSEPTLGEIRFQWWRDALAELQAQGAARQHPVVLALQDFPQTWAQCLNLIDGWSSAASAEQTDNWEALEELFKATNGQLALTCLALARFNTPSNALVSNLATTWGYGSVLHAFLRTQAASLLPKALDTTDPELAIKALQDKSQKCLQKLRATWKAAPTSERQMLPMARLCRLRIEDPQNADDRAAFSLLLQKLKRSL